MNISLYGCITSGLINSCCTTCTPFPIVSRNEHNQMLPRWRSKCSSHTIPNMFFSSQHNQDGYTIGTSHGRIEGRYKRTALATRATRLMDPEDVPDDVISLWEAARLESGGPGQGIRKYSCRRRGAKRCKCVKSNIKCNSCHKSTNCNNRWIKRRIDVLFPFWRCNSFGIVDTSWALLVEYIRSKNLNKLSLHWISLGSIVEIDVASGFYQDSFTFIRFVH